MTVHRGRVRSVLRAGLAVVLFAGATLVLASPASATANVTGVVQLPGGGAATGTTVAIAALNSSNGALVGSVFADSATGSYSIPLDAGSYFLMAVPFGVPQYAGSNAVALTVNSNNTFSPTAPINLSLRPANFVGHVESPAHAPVQFATVVLLDGGGAPIDRTQTHSDGSFTLAIPTSGGNFTIQAQPPIGSQFVTALTLPVATSSGSPVPSTGTLTLRVPLLSGRVTRADTSGVRAGVAVLNNVGQVVASSGTDANGNYYANVAPGTYTLLVFANQGNTDFLAQLLEPGLVVGSSAMTHDVTLVPGNVRGTLLAPNGSTPVAGSVNVFDVAAGQYQPIPVQTDNLGRYAMTLVGTPTPKSYQLTGTPAAGIGAPATYARTTIDVIVGSTTVTRNILLTSANVSGKVFRSDGTTPAPGSFIQVRDVTTGIYLNNVGSGTGFDGTFVMGLPAGTYDLIAQAPFGDTSGLVNTTLRVTVPASGVVANANITLQTANVRGVVTAPGSSTPVPNAWVEVRDANDQPLPQYFGFSVSDGSYALRLPAGSYQVIAHPPVGSSNTWTNGSITITVAGSALTGQTIQLAAANVTGTVRAGGNPIAQAYVNVMDLATNTFLPLAGAPSAGDGSFALKLPNGAYRLTGNPPYNNPNNYTQASIDVTVSGSASSLTINLGSSNVQGRVLRPDGVTPVAGSSVEVQDVATGMYLNDVHGNTSSTGSYGLTVPAAGTYRITARPPWNGTTTDAATSRTVVYSSGTLTGQDITLASPNVTGSVVGPDGTTTIAGSFIDVVDSNGLYVAGASASTTSAGTYGLTLSAGTYTLTARPSWSNPNGYVAGTRVVTVGSATLTGQTITLRTANVTGHVYLPATTTGVANGYIDVFDVNNAYVPGAFAQTQSDGSFGLTLPDGDYTLVAHPPPNGTGNVVAKRFSLHLTGTAANTNITLDAPTVTGSVCRPGGGCTAVPNSWVEVYDTVLAQVLPDLGGMARLDGSFALNVPTGRTYKLIAHPSWSNPNNYVTGETSPFLLTTAGVHDVVLGTANVTGRVCQPGGGCTPVPNAWIEVRQGNAFMGWTGTASNGTYGLSVPANGSYTLIAHPPWDNTSGWTEGSLAITYAGSGLTSQDIVLGSANVRGTVKAPDGTPIRDAYVQVQDATGAYVGIGSPTSSSGAFALRLSTNGNYTLHAFPSWNNPQNLVEGALAVTYSGSSLNNLVVTLGTPNVSGRVLPPTGSTGVAGASVSVLNHTTQAWVAGVPSLANGAYNVALAPGTYDIVAYPPAPNAAGNAPGRLSTVTVSAGVPLTNQDVRLSNGNVSGTVTAAGGGLVANGFVQVYDSGGTALSISAPTRADGTYRLNLANGTYRLRALAPLTGTGSGQQPSAATVVVVNNDTHTANLQLLP